MMCDYLLMYGQASFSGLNVLSQLMWRDMIWVTLAMLLSFYTIFSLHIGKCFPYLSHSQSLLLDLPFPFHSLSLVLLLWICKLLHSLCFSVILLFIFLPCPEPQVWEKAITTEILLRTTFNINVSTLYKNTDEYTWSSEWLKIQWNNNYLL